MPTSAFDLASEETGRVNRRSELVRLGCRKHGVRVALEQPGVTRSQADRSTELTEWWATSSSKALR